MQQKFDASLHTERSQDAATSSSCDVSSSKRSFSEFIADVAWILRDPVLENEQQILTSSHIQRFNYLFDFLTENGSSTILERLAYYVKLVMDSSVTVGVTDTDMKLYRRNVARVTSILCQKFQNEVNSASHVRDLVLPIVPVANQVKDLLSCSRL